MNLSNNDNFLIFIEYDKYIYKYVNFFLNI